MNINTFQVYGERCSGTNFVIRLLERNVVSAQFTEDYGFKHWFVAEDVTVPNDCLVVVVQRKLPDYLRSLHRKPWHVVPALKGLPFSDFIRREWHCWWDEDFWQVDSAHPLYHQEMLHERHPETNERFANVIEMRLHKDANWEGLAARSANAIIVNYEEAAANPRKFLQALAHRYHLKLKDTFEPLNDYKGQKETSFVPKTYDPISTTDQAFINQVKKCVRNDEPVPRFQPRHQRPSKRGAGASRPPQSPKNNQEIRFSFSTRQI